MIAPLRSLALFACAALPFVSGCTDREVVASEVYYQVNIERGAAVELDHPAYDPTLPGYWLVGNDALIQMAHVKNSKQPAEFSFMLRTKPDASEKNPTEIDLFKVLTPGYRIVTKFNEKKTAPVDILAYSEKKAGTEVVLVKSDTTGRYIRFSRVGEYVKVTFTREGMALIGDLVTINWKELPAGKKSDSEHSAAEAEGWRRVL